MHKTILVITDNIRNQINGVVTTFANMEKWAELDGYTIQYLDPSEFPHCDCPRYPEVKLSLPINIGKKIRQYNPDHIHIATEGPLGLAARIYCDLTGKIYNTSYHTKFPEFVKTIYGIPMWITYAYLRWFHKHSGVVLTTTQTMVNNLKQNGFANNVIAWTRGVDRDIFNSALRKAHQPTDKILLNVGRVSKEKGLDDFCSLQYPHSIKVVVGDGPYREELQQKYPDVQFVGAKRGVELAEYFANADVFVFPSVTDTFGIVIIEALTCGTPVAAYNVDGPKDIIEQGINGYMDQTLSDAVTQCLLLSRSDVESSSSRWTWESCWKIFKDNLVP